MTYALTIEAVRKFWPCREDISRVAKLLPKRRKIDAARARELGCTYDDIVWIASAVATKDEKLARRLTHFVNDNAKAVLHLWERENPNDVRPRKAIEACDAFLSGEGSEKDWRGAVRDAWSTWDAAWAAWAAWVGWFGWGAQDARDAWGAQDAFEEWQFDRLVYWLTEDKPEPLPMPEKGVPALPEIDQLERKAA